MITRTVQCVPLPSFSKSTCQVVLFSRSHGAVGLMRHYSLRTLTKLGELQGQMCLRVSALMESE